MDDGGYKGQDLLDGIGDSEQSQLERDWIGL